MDRLWIIYSPVYSNYWCTAVYRVKSTGNTSTVEVVTSQEYQNHYTISDTYTKSYFKYSVQCTSSYIKLTFFSPRRNLSSNANDTTGRTTTGVTSLLRLLVTALTQVIRAGVHNDRTAQNTLGTEQLHERVLLGAGSVTLGVGGEVTQVTDVTVGVLGSTVGLAMGVDLEAPISILSPTSSREQQEGKKQITYSGDRPKYSRWCCHQTGGRGRPAGRWRPGQTRSTRQS